MLHGQQPVLHITLPRLASDHTHQTTPHYTTQHHNTLHHIWRGHSSFTLGIDTLTLSAAPAVVPVDGRDSLISLDSYCPPQAGQPPASKVLSRHGLPSSLGALKTPRASVTPTPSSLVFKFVWSGKRDLVSRSVVSQPSLFGGFNVVDIKFKNWSLQAQWVRRFASSPSGRVSLLDYWFKSVFGATPMEDGPSCQGLSA